ncbi:uncharacterized mitochondrial protein AtMg00810-like [Solanum stenotomum]|uniref:uncharacterized mitochondrial protein AtMg00810-like n=1 Tax=Solanum stenotomum TaxID=172797 RepID=UPI0020D15338|nr:uncharacterized mitochondrial protein AtMg00810-like [Solanum stenotomum]
MANLSIGREIGVPTRRIARADDLIYTWNDYVLPKLFKKLMMTEFKMSDLGLMHYFMGIEVKQYSGGIFISQKKYVQDILWRFGMTNCNSVTTPTETWLKLENDSIGKRIDNSFYKQIVGSSMYLTATRPDIMYSKGGESDLIGFTDSDYAGDKDDRKSTSGYVFMLCSSVISWGFKKQPMVTLSTTKAEFVAAAVCATQAIWLKNILSELCLLPQKPTLIYCDNG